MDCRREYLYKIKKMLKIKFDYKGKEVIIQSTMDKLMKDIFKAFSLKSEIGDNKIYFIYNGNRINEEINCNKLINEEDRNRNIMNILVYDENENIKSENNYQSKEIICPECKENILIKLKNYKIDLYDCKNGHINNNILLNKFENTQNIDISKIICNICKIKNKK